MIILTTHETTSTQSIANKETITRFSDCILTETNFTLNKLSNEFPTTTIQSATDCFRLGRTINQFRRLCLLSTQSLNSVKASEPTYSSINSLNTSEEDNAFEETYDHEDDATADNNEDNLICEMNTHADRYRLCKAKAAHDVVLGKVDASLAISY